MYKNTLQVCNLSSWHVVHAKSYELIINIVGVERKKEIKKKTKEIKKECLRWIDKNWAPTVFELTCATGIAFRLSVSLSVCLALTKNVIASQHINPVLCAQITWQIEKIMFTKLISMMAVTGSAHCVAFLFLSVDQPKK